MRGRLPLHDQAGQHTSSRRISGLSGRWVRYSTRPSRVISFSSAIADRALAERVARHKSIFFREKDGQDIIIDYKAAVHGRLQLAPEGKAERVLAGDYAGMVADGLVFESAPDFMTLIAQCRAIQNRANKVR